MSDAAVVRQITIQGRTEGIPQATSDLNSLASAQGRVVQITDQLRASIDNATIALNANVQNLGQLKAANDNVSSSYLGIINGARELSGGLEETVEHILNTVNHLKLLALAAYAMSPAMRGIVNSGATKALSEIPPVAATAAQSLLSFASPALAFFSRIALPIEAAVVAWEGLNYIIGVGSKLLDQYSDAERKLYAPNVDADLGKLTTFQGDTITPDQQQRAIALASEMAEAKQNISDFLKVQIDLTEPALRLQAAWVGIVSAIGDAAKKANDLIGATTVPSGIWSALGNATLNALPVVGPAYNAARGAYNLMAPTDEMGDRSDAVQRQAMALARQRLSAGLDLGAIDKVDPKAKFGETDNYKFKTFTGRFSQDVGALAAPWEAPPQPKSTDAYDRSIQSIKDQVSVLQLEADGAGKTSQAVDEMKVAHEANLAAMKDSIPVTDAMREQWKALGDQIAAYTIQVNQSKVAQEETFKRATMFMSPPDLAAANAAHQIDPTDWQSHLKDAGPQMAAMTSQLSTARDLATSFGDSIGQGMLQGRQGALLLTDALTNLESSLLKMVTNAAINNLFSALAPKPGASGGGLSGLFGGLFGPSSSAGDADVANANQAAMIGGGMHAGGIVGRELTFTRYVHPAYFDNAPRYHSGGIAGDETPIIAQRGEGVFTPGQMAAMGGHSPVNVTVNNNHSSAGVSIQQQKRGDGGVDI